MKKASSNIALIVILFILAVIASLYFTGLGSIYSSEGFKVDAQTDLKRINYLASEQIPVHAKFYWQGGGWDRAWVAATGFYRTKDQITKVPFSIGAGTIPDNGCLINEKRNKEFILSENTYTFSNLEPGEHEVEFILVALPVADCAADGQKYAAIWEECVNKVNAETGNVITLDYPEKLAACSLVSVKSKDFVRFNVFETEEELECDWWCSLVAWIKDLFR